MSDNDYPGFIINNTTIAVDYWPKKYLSNLTHYFLTHCHTDHTKNLDSSWNISPIHCSKVTKKLLMNLYNIKEEFIVELEMDTTHIMRLDQDETFNVTLIDANHCPGAVMFLFEGYFGVILATGDFRYDPNMFIDTPLENKATDICYLDNTYFNPAFKNIPSRDEALKSIISIIENKRGVDTLFKLHLKILGKEKLLTDLSEYFQTPILVSSKRFDRYVKVLEINKKYFTKSFGANTLLFVEDKGENYTNEELNDFLNTKKIIHIEPTALIIQNQKDKQDQNYFFVPYSDHSSYDELITFVQKLRPKRLIPIVRRMLPKNLDTTDLSVLNEYLNPEPLKTHNEKYKLLLQSSTSIRRSSRLNSLRLSETRSTRSSTRTNSVPNRNPTPINTRYITMRNRACKKIKKQIEYETPEKNAKKQKDNDSDSEFESEPKVAKIKKIEFNSTRRLINISNKKANSTPSNRIQTNLHTIIEENKSDLSFENSNLNENEQINILQTNQVSIVVNDLNQHKNNEVTSDEPISNVSSNKENLDKQNGSKWRRLSDQVEILINASSLSPEKKLENKQTQEDTSSKYQNMNAYVSIQVLNDQTINKLIKTKKTNQPADKKKNEIIEEDLDSEDDLNNSNGSIIIDHTIKDKIEASSSKQIECSILDNLSPAISRTEPPKSSNSSNIEKENEIVNDDNNNHDKLNNNLNTNNSESHKEIDNSKPSEETIQFLDFMEQRLKSSQTLINLNELVTNQILESFQF